MFNNSNNELIEKFQSAYKAGHSTETALLRVTNDLLCSIDKGNISMLTLLDLSAAFDTIDHSILLERLSFTFGIKDKALSLIKSYLQERNQKVKINNLYSNELPVSFGVPQGSVLGPLLFTMYIYPLKSVIDKDIFSYHMYADNTQLYSCYKNSNINTAYSQISSCTSDVNQWMTTNKLKMNGDKTEIMICGSIPKLRNIQIESINIDNDPIDISDNVRNLGFFLDKHLNMNVHVSNLRKSCYFELRKISHVRPFIDEKCAIQLVVSYVLSKLDYCNCLFFNMSCDNFNKLQLVQNHAARIVKRASKRDSAKSILFELHWLPIKYRVSFKIALIVFKCLHTDNFPSYIKDLISIYTPSRTLRSSDSFLLKKTCDEITYFWRQVF